jgi:preprotein translocase subunit SecA
MSISRFDRDFLLLLVRSKDIGDGWRQVSDRLWKLVTMFSEPELIEVDEPNKRVRLTDKGATIVEFAL